MDKYTNLGIYYVHTAFTLAELFALTGFQLTSTTISTSLHAADESVRIIDGLFGSTETSRALAAVVQLVRREMFEDDDYSLAHAGTLTALGGIVKALTVFSCLQVVTWHRSGRDRVGPVIHEADFIDGKVVEPMNPAPNHSASPIQKNGSPLKSIEGAREVKTIEGPRFSKSMEPVHSLQSGYGSNAKELSRQLAILSVKERALHHDRTALEEGDVENRYTQVDGGFDSSGVDPDLLWELESVVNSLRGDSGIEEDGSGWGMGMDHADGKKREGEVDVELGGDGVRVEEVSDSGESLGHQPLSSYSSSPSPSSTQFNGGDRSKSGPSRMTSMLDTVSRQIGRGGRTFRVRMGMEEREIEAERNVGPHEGGDHTHTSHTSSRTRTMTVVGGERMGRGSGRILSPTEEKVEEERAEEEARLLELRETLTSSIHQYTRRDGEGGSIRSSLRKRTSSLSIVSLAASQDSGSIFSGRDADSGSYRGQLSGPTLDTLAPFPDLPLPSLADRYMRHASAAYGPQFLHLLGLAQHHTFHLPRTTFHPNHHAFAEHTGIDVEDVLLSSFTPTTEAPEGGCHALVHYVSYDRAQKAVVLTLRGTMGLSDVLTDLCWDYATLRVGDVDYAVHAGMLEGAKRLSDPQGEVVGMVCRALKAEPTYGLIINGHSLGGGVAALLAIMWSQELPGVTLSEGPDPSGSQKGGESARKVWVTGENAHMAITTEAKASMEEPVQGGRTVGLPTGRRIRCIGFGVPCVMDAELGERYSSLITTIVHGDDVVPSLSLGIVRDFKNVAISLSEEKSVVEDIVRRCIGWERSRKSSFSSSKQDDPSFPSTSFPTPSGPEEADWFWSLIKTMRADMTAEKLCPPGQVYVVENTRAVLVDGEMRVRDTTRIRMVLVRDVRSRFGEVIFGRRMFTDHSPKYYEDALRALSQGARPPR